MGDKPRGRGPEPSLCLVNMNDKGRFQRLESWTIFEFDQIEKTKWLDCRDTALQLIGYIAVTRHFRNLDR